MTGSPRLDARPRASRRSTDRSASASGRRQGRAGRTASCWSPPSTRRCGACSATLVARDRGAAGRPPGRQVPPGRDRRRRTSATPQGAAHVTIAPAVGRPRGAARQSPMPSSRSTRPWRSTRWSSACPRLVGRPAQQPQPRSSRPASCAGRPTPAEHRPGAARPAAGRGRAVATGRAAARVRAGIRSRPDRVGGRQGGRGSAGPRRQAAVEPPHLCPRRSRRCGSAPRRVGVSTMGNSAPGARAPGGLPGTITCAHSSPAAPASSGRTSPTRCSRAATRCSCSTTCRPGRSTTSQHLKGRPGFHYTIDSVTNEPLLAELVDRCRRRLPPRRRRRREEDRRGAGPHDRDATCTAPRWC